MKIITWNVNGIRACAKKGFLDFFKKENPDLLCLQETKAHPEQLTDSLISPLGRESYWSSAEKKGYSGTVTYVKEKPKSIKYGIGIKKFDREGRFVVTEHKDFDLYNVYFPNGAASDERHDFKQLFLKKFTQHLRRERKKGKEIILVGDYNVAHKEFDVHDPKRLSKVSGFLPEERSWLSDFLEKDFVDSFRYLYPDKLDQYTWWSYREKARERNRGWRIDYICVTPGLVKRIKKVRILNKQEGSDHCPVVLELK